MVGRLQTQSLISDAATRATNELSDDELWALWYLIEDRAAEIFDLVTVRPFGPSHPDAAAAIAHLRAILSE